MDKYNQMVQDYKKLIEYEASKYSNFVPLYVVQSEAYKLARKAAESFNPNVGVKFSTYLTNSLKKLSRISTKYGATVRMPENKQFQLNRLLKIEADLKDDLNRPVSVAELSTATGMNISTVNNLLHNRKKDGNIGNTFETPIIIDDGNNDEWLTFVYHDLTDHDKVIFEHKTGYGNKTILSNDELAKKLNVSASTIGMRLKRITDKIKEGWK